MPATFKRVLGSRLRRLAAQGKIEKVNQLKAGVSLLLNKSAKLFTFLSICLVGFPHSCFFWYVLVPMQHQTQNFYKMNGNSFSGMRTPVVARPKEANVKPRQQVPTVSQGKVNHASGTAAFKLVEVEKKLEMVKAAAAEIDKMIQLTEKAETILLLAEELHEACKSHSFIKSNDTNLSVVLPS